MSASLSFDQAPPISVPLRFFLTAPLFLIAAGLALLFTGGDALGSRWHPHTLGLTHLLVAGFMLQAMTGALFQFVPVVTGGNVQRPKRMAGVIHSALTLGAVLLVAGFFTMNPDLFVAAAFFLGTGLILFLLVVGMALVRAEALGHTLHALRGAVFSLLPTTALGIALALALGGRAAIDPSRLLEAHQAWGLAGWTLLLLAGVSWSVVPMFQITPAYPRLLTRYFAPCLLGALGLLSAGVLVGIPLLVVVGEMALLAAAAAFAASTLVVQARRKRKTSDSTLLLFRGAMVCLLAFCAMGALGAMLPSLAEMPGPPVVMGLLLILGVFVSVICGMLYKIVPFLVWLHLQDRPAESETPPHMNKMIPPLRSRWQMQLHFLSLALLLPAPWFPLLARAGGLCLALSAGLLLWNLMAALAIYRRFKSRNPAGAPHRES
ncbi:MAG: hypothetical protein EKK46_00485 [Rhodocyclaceae bacterium]|nr:MAG: hypothetical protein EKK46_00485 [Rhodocyclaceae bacterium]